MPTVTLNVPCSFGTTNMTFSVGPKPGSKSKKVTHIQETRQLEPGGTISEFIAELQRVNSEMSYPGEAEPRVDMETEQDYDFSYARFYVTSWRPMTKHEASQYRLQNAEVEARNKEWQILSW